MATLLSLALGICLFAPEPGPGVDPAAAPGEDPGAPAGVIEVPPPSIPIQDPPGSATAPLPTEPDAAPAEPEGPRVLRPEPAPEPELEDQGYELRGRSDLPLAPTAARKSAVSRGNAVLVRPFKTPVFSAGAVARLGVLLTGGTDVIQPLGYGFGAQLRAHFAPVAKSRIGLELHAGHTRFSERQEFPDAGIGGTSVTRQKLLTATDISAGPSVEIPIGPLFVQLGGSAGVALSTLLRAISADVLQDEQVSVANFMLRGGLSLGIPLLNGHGLNLGAGVHHIFSGREVPIDVQLPEGDQTRPFATSIEVFMGYQIWF